MSACCWINDLTIKSTVCFFCGGVCTSSCLFCMRASTNVAASSLSCFLLSCTHTHCQVWRLWCRPSSKAEASTITSLHTIELLQCLEARPKASATWQQVYALDSSLLERSFLCRSRRFLGSILHIIPGPLLIIEPAELEAGVVGLNRQTRMRPMV